MKSYNKTIYKRQAGTYVAYSRFYFTKYHDLQVYIPFVCCHKYIEQNRESTEGCSECKVRKNHDKFGKRISLNKKNIYKSKKGRDQVPSERPLSACHAKHHKDNHRTESKSV